MVVIGSSVVVASQPPWVGGQGVFGSDLVGIGAGGADVPFGLRAALGACQCADGTVHGGRVAGGPVVAYVVNLEFNSAFVTLAEGALDLFGGFGEEEVSAPGAASSVMQGLVGCVVVVVSGDERASHCLSVA